MRLLPPTVLLLLLPAMAGAAVAQTTIQGENVRYDYAQVLQVEPVYQTLRATAMERRCAGQPAAEDKPGGLSRIVGAVKGALTRKQDGKGADAGSGAEDCEQVPVVREYRRPIAYDVDYVYKGMKYRSRLSDDPGNRLRIRVSVTPDVPADRAGGDGGR